MTHLIIPSVAKDIGYLDAASFEGSLCRKDKNLLMQVSFVATALLQATWFEDPPRKASVK